MAISEELKRELRESGVPWPFQEFYTFYSNLFQFWYDRNAWIDRRISKLNLEPERLFKLNRTLIVRGSNSISLSYDTNEIDKLLDPIIKSKKYSFKFLFTHSLFLSLLYFIPNGYPRYGYLVLLAFWFGDVWARRENSYLFFPKLLTEADITEYTSSYYNALKSTIEERMDSYAEPPYLITRVDLFNIDSDLAKKFDNNDGDITRALIRYNKIGDVKKFVINFYKFFSFYGLENQQNLQLNSFDHNFGDRKSKLLSLFLAIAGQPDQVTGLDYNMFYNRLAIYERVMVEYQNSGGVLRDIYNHLGCQIYLKARLMITNQDDWLEQRLNARVEANRSRNWVERLGEAVGFTSQQSQAERQASISETQAIISRINLDGGDYVNYTPASR